MDRATRRRIRPSVEGMEARVTPVGFFTPAQAVFMELQRNHALGAAAAHPRPAPAPVLAGTAQGTFHVVPSPNPAVTTVTVTGGGFLSPLGGAAARGSLSFREAALPGKLQGTLTLSNGKDSLFLTISANLGRTAIPPVIPSAQVVVTGGTGAFAQLRGAGTATIRLGINPANPSAGSASITFNNITL